MKIALTGATGFIGRYIARRLSDDGHAVRCWFRRSESRYQFDNDNMPLEWVAGSLDDPSAAQTLVSGCDAVVHSALWRPGTGFRGAEGDLVKFAQVNLIGSLGLMQSSIERGVERFLFISTCAVHEKILEDRPLDETHPLWPLTHYGAHKAAIEKFVHSYGLGQGYPICALRPTGVYGLDQPRDRSKWFQLVTDVASGKQVEVKGGGKEVHAADVARAVQLLLTAPAQAINGEAFACYDRYISRFQVASLAKELSGSNSKIIGTEATPRHQIETGKIRALGMEFGGNAILRQTIEQMLPTG